MTVITWAKQPYNDSQGVEQYEAQVWTRAELRAAAWASRWYTWHLERSPSFSGSFVEAPGLTGRLERGTERHSWTGDYEWTPPPRDRALRLPPLCRDCRLELAVSWRRQLISGRGWRSGSTNLKTEPQTNEMWESHQLIQGKCSEPDCQNTRTRSKSDEFIDGMKLLRRSCPKCPVRTGQPAEFISFTSDNQWSELAY